MQLILLIEDDREIREATLEFLAMENFEGIGFPSGIEALAYLNAPDSRMPELIITDMNMPRMDGPTFRAAQLAIPIIQEIPCVVLSADLRIEANFKELRLAGVVRKPIDLDQLSSVIQEAVSRAPVANDHHGTETVQLSLETSAAISEINVHDVLNEIGAAKMHAEILASDTGLSSEVLARLSRIDEKLAAALLMLRRGLAPLISRPSPNSEGAVVRSESKVLLIDDSADLRSLFVSYLRKKGLSVFAAADAQEALKIMAEEGVPHLLLVDMHLREQSASDVLNEIEIVHPTISARAKTVLFTSDTGHFGDPRFSERAPKAQDLKSLELVVRRLLA